MRQKFPDWLKKPWPDQDGEAAALLKELRLHTVCQSAHCPNQGECFSQKRATFLILGNICTRNCRFCAIGAGIPLPLDAQEPVRVGQAVRKLSLKHAVITSVTRDDLPDGGAGQFRDTVRSVRQLVPGVKIEVLTPDFGGSFQSLEIIFKEERPDIFNHNIETVPRLYPQVRPEADYRRSLKVLEQVKKITPSVYTKSGLMVGLGEEEKEVIDAMQDLRKVGCDILTIGQYLSPTREHFPVKSFIPPATFEGYKKIGEKLGFLSVLSAPFVRSSYNAEKEFARISE